MVQEHICGRWADYWEEKTLLDAKQRVERTSKSHKRPLRIMKHTIEEA
jgi:hypothetical protein